MRDEIGRIFRGHNIFEYKSPEDELNIDTFYKVNAYASLYKASGKRVDEIKSEDVSISFIREGKAEKLLNALRKEGFNVSRPYEGIYYVGGKTHFATQMIAAKELRGRRYVWLQALTRKLDQETAGELIMQMQGCKEQGDRKLADSILSVSARANREVFGKVKEGAKMYEVLKELMADEINASIENARREGERRGERKGRQEGERKGEQKGLKVLINTLKEVLPDFDAVYQKVIKNDIYANVSREQMMKYWQ